MKRSLPGILVLAFVFLSSYFAYLEGQSVKASKYPKILSSRTGFFLIERDGYSKTLSIKNLIIFFLTEFLQANTLGPRSWSIGTNIAASGTEKQILLFYILFFYVGLIIFQIALPDLPQNILVRFRLASIELLIHFVCYIEYNLWVCWVWYIRAGHLLSKTRQQELAAHGQSTAARLLMGPIPRWRAGSCTINYRRSHIRNSNRFYIVYAQQCLWITSKVSH